MASLAVVEGARALTALDARWSALLSASGEPAFFLGAAWLAHWAASARGRRVFLATWDDGGPLLAGLPLALGRGRVGRLTVDKLEIAGAPWFDQIEVPATSARARDAFLGALLAWCRAELAGWSVCELREIAKDSDSARAILDAAQSAGLPLRARVCSRAPVVDVRAQEAAPSKNLRSQLKRSAKRLAERGAVELAFVRPSERECAALLDELAAVEAQSWKGGAGVLQPDGGGPFFRALLPELARERAWAVGLLRLDGQLAAYHWGFVEGARFLSYNLAQRPEHDALGPGTFLLQHMVERAADIGVDRLDASRGSLTAPHALSRYGGPVREHLQLLVYNQNAAGRVLRATKDVVTPAIARIKRRFRAEDEA